MTPPPPPPNGRSPVWRYVLTFIAGTVTGWLIDDWVKPWAMEKINDTAQRLVPWDEPIVQWFVPSAMTFASTKIDGCSNGNLSRLVDRAELQGLRFSEKSQVASSHLCQNWKYSGSPRAILEAMAIRFDKCFAMVPHASETTFEVRTTQSHVCKTDYAVNPTTNEWEKKTGAATLLCVDVPVQAPLSAIEPVARECPIQTLRALGIVERRKSP
jgi:hypothetical protein